MKEYMKAIEAVKVLVAKGEKVEEIKALIKKYEQESDGK